MQKGQNLVPRFGLSPPLLLIPPRFFMALEGALDEVQAAADT